MFPILKPLGISTDTCNEDGMTAASAQTLAVSTSNDYSKIVLTFFCLQAADVLTTLVGFRVGLAEASPFIRYLMQLGPFAGLLGSKCVAIVLGGFCVWRRSFRLMSLVNCWYGALVIWNLALILTR
jgi:hypothetical protein